MMDDSSPNLEVGFIIDTGGSGAELFQLQEVMGSTEAKVLADANRIERATRGMVDVAAGTTNIVAFGNAASRELQTARQAIASVEKAGERMVAQLERQNSTFGKTREELRATRVESAALAAEQKGMTELAGRLRAQEAELYDKEFAAARRARFEAEALGEEKTIAAQQAVVAAEKEAQAIRSAALAYDMFEAAARRGMAVQREIETIQKASAADAEAQRVREAALAYGMFEAAARRGVEALRDLEAVQRAAGADIEAQRIREAALAYNMFEAAARRGMTTLRETTAAESAAAVEADNLANAAARLRGQIDPAFLAQQRFDREMTESRTLIAANVITLDEYCAKLRIERAALEQSATAHGHAASSAGAQRAAMQGLGYQAQDTFTQISMGTNILSVLAIQGGQAAGQIANLDGALGKIGQFMLGPWGLALTAAMLVLGALTKGLFDNEEASKKAAEGMKKFQDRQSEIGNFIDATTGKLTEQNRTLVLNAILTRQAQIADNNKAISEQRNQALRQAGNQQTRNPEYTASSVGAPIRMRETDPEVQRAIQAAGGNIDKLATSLARLAATTRPDLKPLALQISTTAGSAILATRENAKLGKELRALKGDTTALANGSTNLIEKQVALATATTPLARAQAQLAIVREGATAADKVGGAALVKYRSDLTTATKAVNSAEAAQKAATAARRDANREANQAARLGRESDAIEAQTRNLLSLADAYQVSGAAALIAEARLKSESKAIRQQADVDAAIAQQIRLVIAQRVKAAAEGTSALKDQAAVQDLVNASIADGSVPAERASQLLRDRLADLPLLTAREAARTTGSVEGEARIEQALDDQRAARDRLNASERTASLLAANAAGADRLVALQAELRLIGATDAARVHELATIQATQEAKSKDWDGPKGLQYINTQVAIADGQQALTEAQNDYNASLSFTADLFNEIDQVAKNAAAGMADAFGEVGRSIGEAVTVMTGYYADQAQLQQQHQEQIKRAGTNQRAIDRENQLFAVRTSTARIGLYGDMASAAKGFFKEGSSGYKTMAAAEKVFRAIELAMAIKNAAMQLGLLGGVTAARVGAAATGTAVDTAATAASVANSTVRATADATAAMAKTAASSPFPFNLAGMAVMAAALASLGLATGFFGGAGSKNTLPKANEGTGTVLGDTSAKSDSVKNAIDALSDVDTQTNTYAREMAASLKSIDSQIGGVATLLVRAGNIDASGGVTEGFKTDAVGSILKAVVPIFGGALSSLFGTKTTVVGNGLFGGPQSVGSILDDGFDASYYSDVQKKKKLFGITTGTKYSTQYTGADATLENQFTLILKQFDVAIASAAGPLGESTAEIQNRLNSFVVDIGKIDLKGLTGAEIQEKLSAVFGAAADGMAAAAFPAVAQFQKVGEGTFETLVRVASTVEAVGASLDLLGTSAQGMSVAVKLGLADQFDSVADLTSAADAYFQAFYSSEEQAAAKTAQFGKVFASLGVAMPATIADFRKLVEAQDMTSAAGQATYATLLQLAPAFADLKESMEGAKSAADILSERQDLQRQLLELQGDTAAIRALDLAKLDASNRALQQQIYAIQDAQAAADAAKSLSDAWTSVGDSIIDEVKRIRGLTDVAGGNSFAVLQGQFNAANSAARAGDQDAAKNLPALSQALLSAAADQATSRQELSRVQAQTAASLEATYGIVTALANGSTATSPASKADLFAAVGAAQAVSAPAAANDDTASAIDALRDELAQLRSDTNAGNAAIASNTGRSAKVLENVASASGGEALSVASAA